jgi:hypothetical protein
MTGPTEPFHRLAGGWSEHDIPATGVILDTFFFYSSFSRVDAKKYQKKE